MSSHSSGSFTEPFHIKYYSNHSEPIGAVSTLETARLSVSIPDWVTGGELIIHTDSETWRRPLCRDHDRLSGEFSPEKPGIYYYHFYLHTKNGSFFVGAREDGLRSRIFSEWPMSFRLTAYDAGFDAPAWFSGGVMYQIFPDRFAGDSSDTAKTGVEYHRSLGRQLTLHESVSEPVKYKNAENSGYSPDDCYGGTLRGIIGRLTYLWSLGVSIIYLNPIFEADSNHRYNTADYKKIDPILGTEADFRELCRKARALGISIILDGVFSHTGSDSVYFNKRGVYPEKGAYQDRASRYFPWYDFSSFPDKYRSWWGFPTLPEVFEENPDWQAYIYSADDSVVKHWLRAGAAGWRLDVADELPDGVLRGIYKNAKAENPDSVIIGEVWEDPTVKISYGEKREYALGGALDTVMNYPLRVALIDFAKNRTDSRQLMDFLLSQRINYPAPMYRSLMNLLSTHDVPRVLTALGTRDELLSHPRAEQARLHLSAGELAHAVRLQTLLAAIIFALPGVPSIYYGDERGMQGAFDPFNRAPINWDDTPSDTDAGAVLFEHYKNLSAVRNSSNALKHGEIGLSSPDGDTLLILRVTDSETTRENGCEYALLAVCRSFEEKTIDVDFADFRGLPSRAMSLLPVDTERLHLSDTGYKIIRRPL